MSVVDEIKDRLDIVEVIQSYVPLRKAGRNYQGLCPFHSEKEPSFVVFPETGTWHCFGACGTGGDVFTFLQKQENLDFGEALRVLAQRAGVELEAKSPEESEAERRLALLREINHTAATYFHHLLLHSDEAARARDYLERRGLSRETLGRFQVGYALDQWDALLRFLTSKGYRLTDVAEVGLIVEREDESGYYDRFRGRIVFPIRDHQGRTIGFGGRILGEGSPKYLNSPQTPLFDKSSVLYGLDQAKRGIRTAGEAVIVEGYMDVLMAHQHGIDNVVAQMGTALTQAQLERLKRHTRRFILALDSDAAGDQATLRGLDVARQVMDREVVPVPTPRGLIRFEDRLTADIRIVSLPQGRDPDEVIRESPSRWAGLIAKAKPVMDYYFQALTADLDLASAKGKSEAVRALGPLVAELGDRVQREHYLQQLARLVQIDERVLWQQIQRVAGSQGSSRSRPRVGRQAGRTYAEEHADGEQLAGLGSAGLDDKHDAACFGLDEHCLSFALCYPGLLAEADEILRASGDELLGSEDLVRPEDRAILATWRDWLVGGGQPDVQGSYYDTLDEALQDRVTTLVQLQRSQPPAPTPTGSWSDAAGLLRTQVLDAITQLRLRSLKRRNQQLRFLYEDAQASGDREAFRRYGEMSVELIARIGRLEKSMNERSLSGRRQREDAAVRVLFSEG